MTKSIIETVVEYNDFGFLVYARDYPGAFTRGRTLEEAFSKMSCEITRYCQWAGREIPRGPMLAHTAQSVKTGLCVQDADSEALFEAEKGSVSFQEYSCLKALAEKSAACFEVLYHSVPDKDASASAPRKTFYGNVPVTAREMYLHTNGVTDYYVSQIGVVKTCTGDMLSARKQAFAAVEAAPDYLKNAVFSGKYDEQWTLKKVMRRFIWHDRIHAKAMYRMAEAIWGDSALVNPFYF